MKEKLIRLRDLIDAKTLRERVMLFASCAAVIVFLAYNILLGPLFAKQTALRAQISQQNNNIMGIDAEIAATIVAYQRDPNEIERVRLNGIKNETTALRASLQGMQASLVPPDRMAPLLENLLRGNKRLRLLSLNSLPGKPINDKPAQAAPADKDGPAPAGNTIYRHGVELTMSGNYLDMLDYMRSVEALPTRLYWGKAELDVQTYPNARLTLTLYTLSLDEKWMTL